MAQLSVLLDIYLKSQGITLDGVSLHVANPPTGSLIVTSQDGRQFRLDGVPAGQQAQATTLVASQNLSDGGQALETSQQRVLAAQKVIGTSDPLFRLFRATLAVLVDEVNLLRERFVALDSAVANAATLAALKTAWATIASTQPMPDRTLAQAKAAVQSKANSSTTD